MKKNIGIVAFLGAGIVALYLLARNSVPPGVQQLVPNADASGVGPNDPMNAGYGIGPYIPAPTPGFTYAPQNAQQYFFGDGKAPAYLTYNTPKGSIAGIPSSDSSDGCCCNEQPSLKNRFTNTGSKLAPVLPTVKPTVLDTYVNNLQSTDTGFHGHIFPSQQNIRSASGHVIH